MCPSRKGGSSPSPHRSGGGGFALRNRVSITLNLYSPENACPALRRVHACPFQPCPWPEIRIAYKSGALGNESSLCARHKSQLAGRQTRWRAHARPEGSAPCPAPPTLPPSPHLLRSLVPSPPLALPAATEEPPPRRGMPSTLSPTTHGPLLSVPSPSSPHRISSPLLAVPPLLHGWQLNSLCHRHGATGLAHPARFLRGRTRGRRGGHCHEKAVPSFQNLQMNPCIPGLGKSLPKGSGRDRTDLGH